MDEVTIAKKISKFASFEVFVLLFFVFVFFTPPFFVNYGAFLVVSTGVIYLIKHFYPTKRPDDEGMKRKYFWQKTDLSSFPSAHAARTSGLFALGLYSFSILANVFLFLYMAIICYARVVSKRHYVKDVVAGVLIGAIIAVLVAPVLETFRYSLIGLLVIVLEMFS